MFKGKFVLFFIIILILGSFWGGVYFGKMQLPISPPQGVLNTELGKPEAIDFSLFWQAWKVLEEKFVDPEKIDYKQMLYGAISGMVSSLDDAYTVFMPPEEAKIFKEDVTGEFQGVGMEIGMRKDELTIISPLEGTPAQRTGLRAGDKIIKINNTETRDLTVDEAVRLIRGPKGTEVVLTIFREGWRDFKEFRIIRDIIEVPSLKWEITDGDIVYLKLYQFSEKASYDFSRAAIEILNSPAKKIILDLRNNPGGYLEVAQDIAGWFLEKGQIVAIEDFKAKNEKKEYKANGPAKFLSYPLIILINQGSASGSEILAGALRDNRGIKLIGEKSFGKGSVQELEELKEGSLKITIARWLTPKGNLITDVGLEPDIKVEMSEKDFSEEKDPQLDKAIEIIKNL